MKKRALSLIATLCLLFALLPTAAFAEDVGKITPYIESVTANPITYGQTLADSSVQGSVYSDSTKQTAVEGSFIWENETIKPTAKDDSNTTFYTVIFKPTDTATYNEAKAQITITVNKAQNAPNMPDSAMSVLYSIKAVFMADLPENWRWQDSNRREALEVEVAKKATAMYNGADKGNYINESIEITITRTDCPEHVAGEIRYDGPFDYMPDCWMDGNGHRECTKCGEILEQVRVPAGHVDANKDHICDREECKATISTCSGGTATCKDPANCEYCGKPYGEIDSRNHAVTEVRNAKNATCTEAGYTGDTYCKDCGTKLQDGKPITKLGHIDADKNHVCDRENCKATISTCSGGTATCKGKAVCDYCGKPYGELNGSTHAGGTYIKNDKAATCNEDGYTGDTYCKGCETKLQDGKPVTKLGHIDADKNHVCDRENCKATISTCSGGTATCKGKAVCDYCGKPYGELNSSNHVGGTEVRNAKEATCTEDGYTGDTYCKGCETKLQDGQPITKLGHIDADKNHVCDRENCKATLSTCSGGTATCKDKAVCDYCGKPYGDRNGSTHAGGTYIKNDKAATCNEDGYTGDTYCKGCETKLQDGKPITKLGHIDADKNHVCDRENCKATLSTCSGGTATCKDKAVCDYCGKPYGELDSSNHAGGTEVRNAKDATCTEDGYTGDTYCKGCETKLSSGKSVDKTGHDYESKVTKEATTTSTGTKTYTCKNCGHSYEEEIAKLPSQSTSPKTGDETPLVATIVVTLLSAAALIVLVTYKKRGRYSAK